MAQQELDPITLQVISGALDTIAEEMGHILYRMSFSSIIRESQDLGAGLFDTEFNTLCESESTPLHIGSLPGYLAGIQESLQGGEWNDGDVVIHNHPYYGSSHSRISPSSSRCSTRASWWRSPPIPLTTSTSGRRPRGSSSTSRTCTPRHAVRGHQALRAWQAQ